MTTYLEERAALSRTQQILVVMTLDYCGRTFGTAPCLATGTPCYNTWPTCKYTAAYQNVGKEYKFSLAERPLIGPGIRPYLDSYKELATEIDPSRGVAVNAKVTLDFYDDENDTDIGIDPYVSQRASVQGTFWKKLLARNTYYPGRTVVIKKGFLGNPESEYRVGFKGIIDAIDGPNKGKIKVVVKDYLKKADKVDIPAATKGVVTDNPLVAGANAITLNDASEYSASGWIRIDDEIISYSGKNGNQLTGCARGQFGTSDAQHSSNAKVQQAAVWQAMNPWDIINDILVNKVGFASGDVDSTGATTEKSTWLAGYSFTGVVSKPMKASELLKELCEQCQANIWWDNEGQLIRFKVMAPATPGQSVKSIDDINMIEDSASVDRNETSRVSRVIIYFAKKAAGEDGKPESYSSIDIGLDQVKEGANEYNETAIKKIYSRWITQPQVALHLACRVLGRYKVPPILYTFKLELKDDDLKAGDLCTITTNDILDITGSPEPKTFQVLKKEPRGREVSFKGLDTMWALRFGFIAPAGYPDYGGATAEQHRRAFIGNANNKVNGGAEDGYYIW